MNANTLEKRDLTFLEANLKDRTKTAMFAVFIIYIHILLLVYDICKCMLYILHLHIIDYVFIIFIYIVCKTNKTFLKAAIV